LVFAGIAGNRIDPMRTPLPRLPRQHVAPSS